MENYNYYFEIQDILKQFVAAFDDAVIKRYNESKNSQDNIKVRYLNAPKQRVLHDIISQEPHSAILPVVTFNVTNISRDESRLFNKISSQYRPKSNGLETAKIPQPVPVNIEVNMTMITKFELDFYQIISNFVPYTNPYIIITWKVPTEAGLDYSDEIRTEVLWNGSITPTMPTELAASDKYRISGDTSFTIKTWLFKDLGEIVSPIYFINADFYDASMFPNLDFSYSDVHLLSTSLQSDTPGATLSGYPQVTNVYYSLSGIKYETFESITLDVEDYGHTILLYGKNFSIADNFALSSNVANTFSSIQNLTSEYGAPLSAYPLSSYSVLTDNIMTITLPINVNPGKYDIVVHNFVGWQSTGINKTIYFDLT